MKLHLPKLLRHAVLACISAVAGLVSTTVGTVTVTGGALFAFAISGSVAFSGVAMGATTGEIDTTDTNLKAYWNFDTSNNPVVNTITNQDGTSAWNNLPTWNSSGYGECTTTTAHPNTPSAGLTVANGFTISFDINDITQSGTVLTMYTQNKAWRTLHMTVSDTGSVEAYIQGAYNGNPTPTVSGTLDLTQDWNTITLVGSKNSSNNHLVLDLYVDGINVSSGSVGATNFATETANYLSFGHHGTPANSASMNIDNILVYSRALTATELVNLTMETLYWIPGDDNNYWNEEETNLCWAKSADATVGDTAYADGVTYDVVLGKSATDTIDITADVAVRNMTVEAGSTYTLTSSGEEALELALGGTLIVYPTATLKVEGTLEMQGCTNVGTIEAESLVLRGGSSEDTKAMFTSADAYGQGVTPLKLAEKFTVYGYATVTLDKLEWNGEVEIAQDAHVDITITGEEGIDLSGLDVQSGAELNVSGVVCSLKMTQAGTVEFAGAGSDPNAPDYIAPLTLTDAAVLYYATEGEVLDLQEVNFGGGVVIGAGLSDELLTSETGFKLGLGVLGEEAIDLQYYTGGYLEKSGDDWYLKKNNQEIILVETGGVKYDEVEATGKTTIQLAGGTLTLGNTPVAEGITTLTTSAAGGAIEATGSVSEVTFGTVSIAGGGTMTLKDGATDLTLKAGALSLGEGSKIVVEKDQVLDLTAIDYKGDDGSFADMVNAVSGAGTVKAKATGAVVLRKDANLQTNLQMENLELNSWQETNPGKILTIKSEGHLDVTDTLIIESAAKLTVEGGEVSAGLIKIGHSDGGIHVGHLNITGGTVKTGAIVRTTPTGVNSAPFRADNTFTMSGGILQLTGNEEGIGIDGKLFINITGGTLKAVDANSWGITGATIGGATIETDTGTITLTDATLTGSLNNESGIVKFTGTINLDTVNDTGEYTYTPSATDGTTFSEGTYGYTTSTKTYEVVDTAGNAKLEGTVTWTVDGSGKGVSYDSAKGEVIQAGALSDDYYIEDSELSYSEIAKKNADGVPLDDIVLTKKNGFTLDGDLDSNAGIRIEYTGTGDLEITESGSMKDTQLTGTSENKIANLTGSGTYELTTGTALAAGVHLADSWVGKVKMGDISTPAEALNISSLGKGTTTTASSIEMGAMNVKSLTSSSGASVTAASLAVAENSSVTGDLTVTNSLTLGGESAATMTVDGKMTTDRIVLGNASSTLVAESLETTGSSITIGFTSQNVLDALNDAAASQSITLITLTEAYTGTGANLDTTIPTRATTGTTVEKYSMILEWDTAKTNLIYSSKVNSNYVQEVVGAQSENGRAGVQLLQKVLETVNPQVTAPASALAAALNAVDAGTMTEDTLAALAGASTAVLGMAAQGDVDRQLQAIRNRTTTMGVDQGVVHPEIPYFNAWINAEGDRRELSDNGTEGGYELNSWGGTVGFDVDFTSTFTAGLALTAMKGDLDATGADAAKGDLDTTYVTAFARYCASAWTHTFVATVGKSDITLDRTVMGNELKGETEGMSFGIMYEVGRVYALTEDATACIQPVFNVTWRHTAMDGYTEEGGDLALEVDDQTLNTVTFGLGARVQAVVGENMYNRASIFECRLMAKADVGDRRGSSDVALAGTTAEVESAEMGPIGIEAGAGLTIPLGEYGSSLFMDASVEFRADYTNVNGTVGYRLNF